MSQDRATWDGRYGKSLIAEAPEEISPLALPELVVRLEELFRR